MKYYNNYLYPYKYLDTQSFFNVVGKSYDDKITSYTDFYFYY
jgi:hypothetical protein